MLGSVSCNENYQGRDFLTPPPRWRHNGVLRLPAMPASERAPRKSPQAAKVDLFHVVHKVPVGDSPYVRAKHVQLIDKDPSRAISLFWAAINAGDRVESALKDMAVAMKQLDRSDEAIEAIKSFRHLCHQESQDSLDNVLLELYKASGRIEDEIDMLQLKLKQMEEGMASGGKQRKMARSQGRKVHVTVEKEYSRLLGNLAWAFMQQKDYKSAEEYYRQALSLEPDKNKQCNLAICLIHLNKRAEARVLLRTVQFSAENGRLEESYAKSFERAVQMMDEADPRSTLTPMAPEREVFKGVSTPVSDRGMRGHITPNGEDQSNNCASVASRSFPDVCVDRKSKLVEWKRSSCNQSFHDNRINPVYCGRGTPRRKFFCSSRVDNRFSTGTTEVGLEREKANASPFSTDGVPIVPFTQPRRNSWTSRKVEAQCTGWVENGAATGDCCRKLLFEQPAANNSCTRFAGTTCSSINSDTLDKTMQLLSEKNSPSSCSSDHRWKNILADSDKASTGEKSVEQDCVRPPESPCPNGGNSDQSPNVPTRRSLGLKEIAEYCMENLKATQQLDENHEAPLISIPMDRSKKSWADMVEEDLQWLSPHVH